MVRCSNIYDKYGISCDNTVLQINPCYTEKSYVLHSSPVFYPVNLQISSYMLVFTSLVESSVDPDQMAS